MRLRAVDVRITGVVQGVFFRAGCAREAERLGVVGWVRNEPDGAVRARLEGSADQVGRMLDWCHQGSPRAVVERVEVTDVPVEGRDRFEVG